MNRARQPLPTEKRLEIAVVIPVWKHRFWVQLRRESGSLDGCWEFPGGKVRRGESPLAAGSREMAEETGTRPAPSSLEPVVTVDHEYPDRWLRIHFFKLEEDLDLTAVPGRWVTLEELRDLRLPDANRAAIDRIAGRW